MQTWATASQRRAASRSRVAHGAGLWASVAHRPCQTPASNRAFCDDTGAALARCAADKPASRSGLHPRGHLGWPMSRAGGDSHDRVPIDARTNRDLIWICFTATSSGAWLGKRRKKLLFYAGPSSKNDSLTTDGPPWPPRCSSAAPGRRSGAQRPSGRPCDVPDVGSGVSLPNRGGRCHGEWRSLRAHAQSGL
jgi:hypothetical protein